MQQHTRRVALVTGANRGIGYEISRQLAQKGITVVMGGRDARNGRAACDRLGRPDLNVYYQALDVTEEISIRSAVAAIEAARGRLDILVNNAGIYPDSGAAALDVSMETVRRSLLTHTLGPLLLCQLCIPIMRRGGYGRIVNLASAMGSFAEMTDRKSASFGLKSPAYRLSKAGLNAVTVMVAKEVSGENILVNSCCPGWVRTDMGGPEAPLGPEQGADTPVWLATLEDGGPSGGFFRERARIPW
jgi:NAD(P)-dependent dehydrogenase (short-subunit alcohol dehydrogenase family)